ncbi:MAG: hypothetical protein GY917_13800, partial [Planctomycetaceae bacterium]|nr:hypothetical protein [Planctomycetaceae bacterium]
QPGQQPGQQPGRAAQQSLQNLLGGRQGGANQAPITGGDYREWTDQLRNVEELLEDPKWQADVARIRDRARSVRSEYKRHSKDPNWDLVRDKILNPLAELQDQLQEEILRQQSPDTLVPIDRDPVPNKFENRVRRYFERLGNER